MEMSQRDLQLGLQEVEARLRAEGIWSDSVRRIGNISDTIEGAIPEHTPDLLLLGAYGYGPIDRPRLGSTAEHLLRTVCCPVFVAGPDALFRNSEAPPSSSILVLRAHSTLRTISFLLPAIWLAGWGRFWSWSMWLILCKGMRDIETGEQRCEEWSAKVRDRGVRVTWSLLYGRADKIISDREKRVESLTHSVWSTP